MSADGVIGRWVGGALVIWFKCTDVWYGDVLAACTLLTRRALCSVQGSWLGRYGAQGVTGNTCLWRGDLCGKSIQGRGEGRSAWWSTACGFACNRSRVLSAA